jgi:chemotaxis protein CheC
MLEADKLGLVGGIGIKASGMVAESRSQMVGMNVSMDVSVADIIPTDKISHAIGDTEKDTLVGVSVAFEGEIPGDALFIYTPGAAREFAGILLAGMESGAPADGKILSDMEESALLELTNIITSGFIDVWAAEFKVILTQLPPSIPANPLTDVMGEIGGRLETTDNLSLVFDSTLKLTDINVDLNILVLPDLDVVQLAIDEVAG